jgi:hypothetical protein
MIDSQVNIMVNAIIEYLKRKFTFKSKTKILNDMTSHYSQELYEPLQNYEWADRIRKKQEELFDRKY